MSTHPDQQFPSDDEPETWLPPFVGRVDRAASHELRSQIDRIRRKSRRPSLTMTIEEAVMLLGISRSTAYQYAKAGNIPTTRISARLVVPIPDLAALINCTVDDVLDALEALDEFRRQERRTAARNRSNGTGRAGPKRERSGTPPPPDTSTQRSPVDEPEQDGPTR